MSLNFLLEHLKPECLALPAVTQFVPLQIRRRGVEMRLVLSNKGPSRDPDRTLLKAIARGYKWFQELASGRSISTSEIARREGIDDGYVRRLMLLGLIAPRVIDSIAEGMHKPELTANCLPRPEHLPLDWKSRFFKFFPTQGTEFLAQRFHRRTRRARPIANFRDRG